MIKPSMKSGHLDLPCHWITFCSSVAFMEDQVYVSKAAISNLNALWS